MSVLATPIRAANRDALAAEIKRLRQALGDYAE